MKMVLTLCVAILATLMGFVGPASAGGGGSILPLPQLAEPRGEECIRPTSYMRRYHMVMLKHKLTRTLHEGIRTPDFSLKACIECHAAPTADGRETIEPFCGECHSFAGVTLDCFGCHTPGRGDSAGGAGAGHAAPHAAASHGQHDSH